MFIISDLSCGMHILPEVCFKKFSLVIDFPYLSVDYGLQGMLMVSCNVYTPIQPSFLLSCEVMPDCILLKVHSPCQPMDNKDRARRRNLPQIRFKHHLGKASRVLFSSTSNVCVCKSV